MWLEVGCPFCSTILVFPRTVEGRSVRCPECTKSYLVPVPNTATLSAAAASPVPVAPIADEPAVAKVSEPAGKAASSIAPHSTDVPPAAPKIAAEARQTEPQLALHSPLPAVPILDPPQLRNGQVVGNAAPEASPNASPVGIPKSSPPLLRPTESPARPQAPATQTLKGPVPPLNPAQQAEAAAQSHDAQLRMRRTEIRALANLIIFVLGTLAMVGFAWVIVQVTRRR